jgi:HSP20 family protein
MANLVRRDNREVARNTGQEFGRDTFSGWDPFRMMESFLRWDPFREQRGWFSRSADTYLPQFDVKETRDGYVFTADLPGVKEADLDISVTGNVLTVAGKREEERRQEGEQYYAVERGYGVFTRSFSLPEGADTGSVHAALEDGVLRVHLGKRPEVQPRRIPISGDRGGRS